MVTEELEQFLLEKNPKKVLLFPPFPNRLRFLTHRITESYDDLSSFSVGEGFTRRTVVCHVGIRIQDHSGERTNFNRNAVRFHNYLRRKGRGGRDGTAGFLEGCDIGTSSRTSRGPGRSHFSRRPDKDLYIPAALRKKYGYSESERQVVDEPEQISVEAGKNIYDILDVKETLLSECNKRDSPSQTTEDLEKYSIVAPMDVIPSTVEHKTIVPVFTKPVDQLESNRQIVGMTKITVEYEGKVAEAPATMVEAMAIPVGSLAEEIHSRTLTEGTTAAEPFADHSGVDHPTKVLESSKSATEGESNQVYFSGQVGKAMRLEDNSRNLMFAETFIESSGAFSLVDEAVRLEVSSDLDSQKTSLQVQNKVVDLSSTSVKTNGSENACNNFPQFQTAISEDNNVVLGKPCLDTELESEVLDCKEANIECFVGSPGINLPFKMQDLDHCGKSAHEDSSVNGIQLIANNKVEAEMVDAQESIYESAGKEPDEPMDVHLVTSGAEDLVCMSDPNDSKQLHPAISGILHDKDRSEKLSLADEVIGNKEPSAANNTVETFTQAIKATVVSDSEMASLCHKNVQLCLDGGKTHPTTPFYTEENAKSPTDCENKDVMGENATNASPVNPVRSTFRAVECGYVPSCAKVEVVAEHDQESFIEEENIQQLLQEIKVHLSEKDISIGNLKYDYTKYSQPGNVKFSQIIEIYGFLPQIDRADLMEAFAEFPESEFRLQWVDSTHALGIFCSEKAVSQALAKTHPFLKFRPLSEGTKQSKLKAYNCLDLPEPYKERPQTDSTVAKRFLNRALGLPQKRKAIPENIPDSESVPAETVQSLEPFA